MTYLDLSWNDLKAEAIEIVCGMLKRNNSLKELMLMHNEFGPKGAKLIAEALYEHDSI